MAHDRTPPGMVVLLDLMQGKQLAKALLHHVLGPGYEQLEVGTQAKGQPSESSADF